MATGLDEHVGRIRQLNDESDVARRASEALQRELVFVIPDLYIPIRLEITNNGVVALRFGDRGYANIGRADMLRLKGFVDRYVEMTEERA